MTQSVNESISNEAVYRTAPATPGLLNTMPPDRPRRSAPTPVPGLWLSGWHIIDIQY